MHSENQGIELVIANQANNGKHSNMLFVLSQLTINIQKLPIIILSV